MFLLRRAVGIVRSSLRSFLLVNLVYFGLVGSGMAYGASHPDLHQRLAGGIRSEVASAYPTVTNAYLNGHFLAAVVLTVSINVLLGAFVCITLPTLVVPFAGLLTASARAITWGLIFVPDFSNTTAVGITRGALVGLLLLLEGSGFVLAMFGAYLHSMAVLRPATVGADSRWAGYKTGLRRSLEIYPLIALVLMVSAVYEAMLVIWFIPLLK